MASDQVERYPFGDGSDEPVYLTNGCCEDTGHVDAALLASLGLEAGEWEGDFYPLTDAEAKYIYEDLADVADGFGAMTGYSALYQGKKFLMPSIELYFGEDGIVSEADALAFGKAYAEDVKARVEGIGGHVFLDEEHDQDRHLIQVLVPVEYAMRNAKDFDGWKDHLASTLLKSDLTVESVKAASPKVG